MRSWLRGLPGDLALAVVSSVAGLALAEVALRAVLPPTRGFYTIEPGTEWTMTASPDIMPGVSAVAHFHANRFGIRGRVFGDDHSEYRILAVGGSTTQCAVLDDTKVWTYLLEAALDRTADGRRVWVGNVGRNGTTARDHVLHLKYLLPQYPRIDVVVALVGVNDLLSALRQGWHYVLPRAVTEPAAEAEQMPRAFALAAGPMENPVGYGRTRVPWYKATALWQLARRAASPWRLHRAFTWPHDDPRQVERARLERHATPALIDSLPPLDAPLFEYRRNLNAMADIAARAGVRLVFVTQPSAWRENMTDAEEQRLWLGWLAPPGGAARPYYTRRSIARAMARYNETLLGVCRERGLDCVDAARVIPRDTTALYDEVHFNEQGSRMLARALAGHFRARPPF